MNLLQILASWFCLHHLTILRYREGFMWSECLNCGHESEGVQVRGPEVK